MVNVRGDYPSRKFQVREPIIIYTDCVSFRSKKKCPLVLKLSWKIPHMEVSSSENHLYMGDVAVIVTFDS